MFDGIILVLALPQCLFAVVGHDDQYAVRGAWRCSSLHERVQ